MPPTILVDDTRVWVRLDASDPRVRAALHDVSTGLAVVLAADARARAQAHIRFLGKQPWRLLASIKGGVSCKQARHRLRSAPRLVPLPFFSPAAVRT